MTSKTPSIQAMITLSVVGALVALAVAAASALWGFAAAERQIARATQSYDQLALATRIDAEIGRLLINEISAIVAAAPVPEKVQGSDEGLATIDRLLEKIAQEIESLDDPDARSNEREEYKSAFAIRALFANMLRGIDRHRSRVASFGSGQSVREFVSDVVVRDFAQLDRIVKAVVADERGEVRDTLSGLTTLRSRMLSVASITLLACSILAIALAYLFYRVLMRPLHAIATGASALAEGDLEHRIPIGGPPELAELAKGFNNMAERLVAQQDALRRVNERLEATVAERTRELEVKATRLQQVDASRKLFFAKVGHELRTPLSVILGEAELSLQEAREPTGSCEMALARVLIEGRFLQRRIADLLAVARSEDGRLTLDMGRVDLREVLKDLSRTAQSYAEQNDVQLDVHVSEKPAIVRGDAEWLRQGMLALVDNAIKHAVEAGLVQLVLREHAGKYVLTISDNGPGVEEEYIPRLFEPFFQGQGEIPVSRAGAGLGLAVARWVSVSHGASIDAENSPGGGFCVRIEIPAIENGSEQNKDSPDRR